MAYDYMFEILLIGQQNVGKSCLRLRFADDTFDPSYISTIGVDFSARVLEFEDKRIKLQLWDTSCSSTAGGINTYIRYLRKAHGILICFDVTSEEPFRHLDHLFAQVDKYATGSPELFLVGCRCDCHTEWKVTASEAVKFAGMRQIEYVETSAKDGTGIVEAFEALCAQVLYKIDPNSFPKVVVTLSGVPSLAGLEVSCTSIAGTHLGNVTLEAGVQVSVFAATLARQLSLPTYRLQLLLPSGQSIVKGDSGKDMSGLLGFGIQTSMKSIFQTWDSACTGLIPQADLLSICNILGLESRDEDLLNAWHLAGITQDGSVGYCDFVDWLFAYDFATS